MNHLINQLIQFALDMEMITEDERDYSVNLLLDLFHEDNFYSEEIHEHFSSAVPILDKMLDYAVQKQIIDDTITSRDSFDTKIMNCVMPRPHSINEKFKEKYMISPKNATDYFYQLSLASNYIRKSRTDKNIVWKKAVQYGNIEISINLSKPEKDPQEIAQAKSIPSTHYPKCALCKENVGLRGHLNHAARQNHRIVPIQLASGNYYLQYSPYAYYREHCIIFNEHHQPMSIGKETFQNLLSFLDLFPHYMIGSNADLPIVGGSILSHDHYQGGHYEFPMQNAQTLKTFHSSSFPHTTVEILKWPLSTLRLTSKSKDEIIDLSFKILKSWKNYNQLSLDIISHTENIPHNTITPIARYQNNQYQMDLVLRNNRTNAKYPDGIFHPHPEYHHIKKENLGLIEVMGLAILPPRLKKELELLSHCLLKKAKIEDYPELTKHLSWYNELLDQYEFTKDNIEDILKESITIKFIQILENAGVFKMNDIGIHNFISFIEEILNNK